MYEINKDLENSVLKDMPTNYSNLEKAVYIYYELCKRLQYSMDFYMNEPQYRNWFKDVDNLKKIDGVKNKDVVCFTFNAIFLKILVDTGIISSDSLYQLEIKQNQSDKAKRVLPSVHLPVIITIDGIKYDIDATYGVLDNNDLVLSKYKNYKIEGWISKDKDDRTIKDNNLEKTIEKVLKDNNKLKAPLSDFIDLKTKNNETIQSMPLDNRIKLFLNIANKLPGNNMQSLNNILKLKHLFFTKKECSRINNYNSLETFVNILFCKDSKTNQPKALLFYNPKGYFNDEGFENFDSLKIFDISLNGKGVKQLSVEEAKTAFETKQIIDKDNNLIQPPMLKKGFIHIRDIFDENTEADQQIVSNKIGEYRYYPKTGEKGPIIQFGKRN